MNVRGPAGRPTPATMVGALVLLASAGLSAQSLAAQETPAWHGYTQVRYGRADPTTGFSIRRAKLWMTGPVPGVSRVSFRVQGIFRNGAAGGLVLQDVFADVGVFRGTLRVGQFVPAFSLERSQPDYLVPLIERAAVVETVIPGARTMGREVGAQLSMASRSGAVDVAVGLFNGSGGNRVPGVDGDFLTTGRLLLSTRFGAGMHASFGGSVAWRRTHGTDVGSLHTAGSGFAGSDFRWGGDVRLGCSGWGIQAEYLHTELEDQVSRGFYVLSDLAVTPRDNVTLSVERLDTPTTVRSEPWYVAGFSHLLGNSNPAGSASAFPTRLMGDVRYQVTNGKPTVEGAVQLQVFIG